MSLRYRGDEVWGIIHCSSATRQRRNAQRASPIAHRPEKPTNCGTKAAYILANSLPANFNANKVNILVHLQQLWLHSAYHFKVLLHLLPFGRNLKGEFEDTPNLGGLGSYGRVRGSWIAPIESPPTISHYPPKTKFCSICCHLAGIPMSSIGPQFDSPKFGVRVALGDRKRCQSKSRPHIPIRLLYTLYAYLAPFGHNTQRGRQTDRAIGIGRLNYSNGGLKSGLSINCKRYSLDTWPFGMARCHHRHHRKWHH